MPVIVRDAVASDHLVFAWPFPIGPEEHEIACADDELVVMCPSFMVGDRLGPGRHRWRTSDPMRPVSAYFVLTAPVEVSFDMLTQFIVPATGMGVRIRATGSLQVRCMDPALLIAQFVGLPFDHVNDGVLRSVSRSVERMLARLLTRRVVMAGTPNAIIDPSMLPNIIEELIAYNPAAGAVFGIELVRMGHMTIMADDGQRPWQQMMPSSPNSHHQLQRAPNSNHNLAPNSHHQLQRAPNSNHNLQPANGTPASLLETQRSNPAPAPMQGAAPPPKPVVPKRAQSQPQLEASGEIVIPNKPRERPNKETAPGHAVAGSPLAQGSDPHRVLQTPVPRNAGPLDVPSSELPTPPSMAAVRGSSPGDRPSAPNSAILGIGMAPIGESPKASAPAVAPAGDASSKKIPPGGRCLVPGPNGLMMSATVRQLLQGYYELEVGGSGETIWVPVNGVVPE